ncbi:PepSY domain-containing protein [Haliscomenobacter sp.]|uniref:PepSY domain-containing protein n=1 Tax=Haliscomenobacter sp. TaxID=2717303 RepID=UPI0035932D9F
MNKSWRVIHYISTLFAGGFILLAALTGCILAVEPWFLSQNAVSGKPTADLTLTAFQEKLGEHFLEIFSLETNAYGNIKVEGIGMEKEGALYVSARTGEVLEAPKALSSIFNLSRDLHRSLFLKTPGRILVGLASLALVFLAISGIALHIKRAGGIRAVLNPIKILELKRDGHAKWSRWFFIPILIVAVSGTYLSVVRFIPTPKKQAVQLTADAARTPLDGILLREVKKVSFPVLDEDPLVIELADRHLYFDKNSRKITKVEQVTLNERLRLLNFILHTGEGSMWWSGVLLLSSLVMLFLGVTGFQMVVEKWKTKQQKHPHDPNSDTYILVGSETGHTWRFATALEEAYAQMGVVANTLSINKIPTLSGKKTLLFLSSTYGDGDAPENAQGMLKQLEQKLAAAESIQFSVLGFGSSAYPAFCAYAATLRDQLKSIPNTQEITPYLTVDNQSVVQFMDWVKALNKYSGTELMVDTKKLKPVRKKGLESFHILEKKEEGETFLLRIAHSVNLGIVSGDLLGVYPPDENIERYYSIAALGGNELVLVIKRTGLCSNYLGNLSIGDHFEAFVKRNVTFHRPAANVPVLMVANGTGIAPFLGMQSGENQLFWGGRYPADFELYRPYFNENDCLLKFSRGEKSGYVQDLLVEQPQQVVDLLSGNGVMMICGSLTMLKGVWEILEKMTEAQGLPHPDELKRQKRILVDCY